MQPTDTVNDTVARRATPAVPQKKSGGEGTDWRALLSPHIVALIGLLAAQLLLALVLGFGGRDFGAASPDAPLLAFDEEQVTRVRIETPDKDPLLVEKIDGQWSIPALGDFPAAELKVTDLLGKLAELKKRLPVATSQTARKRFLVADDLHERRLTLEDGDRALATLYLGDSPGFRRLFVRAEGEQAVYEADMALFDASENPDDWSDKTVLHLAEEDLRRVELPDATLERVEGTWRLADLAEGEALDEESVDDAIRRLAQVNFLAVREEQNVPEPEKGAPAVRYEITTATGETLEYQISGLEDSENYVLRTSARPHLFELSKYTVEGLTEIERSALIQENSNDGTEVSEPPSASPPDDQEQGES
ncbi:MAG: DUF4340 domain-containing protein [Pseudomonadota bacterium]|nr:DUF4340 domain-containing protein [Pseudomonadota bacterium]